MKYTNPWLPWTPTISVATKRRPEQLLVIIPTAGDAISRLDHCLASLELAAGQHLRIHPIVVLCPATPKSLRSVRTVCRNRAEVVALPGRFNYCRSINEGLLHRSHADTAALFLNDDVLFTAGGSLRILVRTLREQNWACVGPHITGWHDAYSSVPRQSGPVRTNEPVNGCCAMWDMKWLDRISGLDVQFGHGWGLDEADACLRALRRGAQFGREDRVSIQHAGHATFGQAFTRLDGPAHRRNMRLFATKHGGDVGTWGQTHHWWPMPGVQVSIAAYNAAKWFERCLDSVETSMDGYRWSLVIGDDCSQDRTVKIAQEFQAHTSADVCIVRSFHRKAMTVDQAKNRVLRMGANLRKKYPAMCLMDADDEMLPGRLQHLLWRARDGGHLAVLGDFQQAAPDFPEQDGKIVTATEEAQISTGFGPWATLFHSSLVPSDSRLFREHKNQISHGDVDLWVRWFRKGIHFEAFPGELVHKYYWHAGTASRPVDKELANWAREVWRRRKSKLLGVDLKSHVTLAYSQPLVTARSGSNRFRSIRAMHAQIYSQPVMAIARRATGKRAHAMQAQTYSQPVTAIANGVSIKRVQAVLAQTYSQTIVASTTRVRSVRPTPARTKSQPVMAMR